MMARDNLFEPETHKLAHLLPRRTLKGVEPLPQAAPVAEEQQTREPPSHIDAPENDHMTGDHGMRATAEAAEVADGEALHG